MEILILVVAAISLVGAYAVVTYNFFVSSKARIKAAIQEIGNQLKRQADLIPNLETSAKGFLKHEKGIFKELAEARKAVASAVKSGNAQKMADAGSMVSNLVPRLSIAVEDNPEIKGSDVVVKLMAELRDTSDKVMYARRLVIDLTADYNVKRVTFPSSLVAGMFKFEELEGMIMPEDESANAVSAKEMKTPKVDL